MTRTLLPLALALLGCRPGGVPAEPATLEGLELPLAAAPSLRLVVDGRVGPVAALVELEPGQALGLITPGCGLDAPLQTPTRVANPFGGVDALALVQVEALSLGGVPVAPFEAGLVEGPGCRVVLGEPALGRLALEVRLAARTVRLARTRPLAESLAALPPGREAVVVPVAREPRYDWPLVTVRAVQGAAHLEVPLLLRMGQPWSRLYEGPVRAAGLRPGEELLRGKPAPTARRFEGLALDALQLAPGAELRDLPVELEPGDAPRLPQGILAADAWGRFDVRLDLPQGVLLLHRPRLEGPGRCGAAAQASAEACLEVTTRRSDAGLSVGAVVWRDLPEGARLSLDVVGAELTCRVGLSFPATDRGRGAFHTFPWGRLQAALPACAAGLAGATGLSPGLFEEGSLPGCPGLCAFAQDRASGQLRCECQPVRRGEDEAAARRLLELARRLRPDAGQPTDQELEPADPR